MDLQIYMGQTPENAMKIADAIVDKLEAALQSPEPARFTDEETMFLAKSVLTQVALIRMIQRRRSGSKDATVEIH